MKTLEALNRLKQTNIIFPKQAVPCNETESLIKTQLKILQELTYIYILDLLSEENENELKKIVARLKTDTPFYDFTFLCFQLSKEKTNFNSLTSPENIQVYEKIFDVAKESKITLPPYINVLRRISDNKLYGLYSENQEVSFFLDEYDKQKNAIRSELFLKQFKKILKYETQKIFELFIEDEIFKTIKDILNTYSEKITNEQILVFYIYGLKYYNPEISNDDENILLKHLEFCVSYLYTHKEIEFKSYKGKTTLPLFSNEEEAIKYFVSHNHEVLNSVNRFIGFFKDVLPTTNVYEFCDYLRANIHSQNPRIFDVRKNQFNSLLATYFRKNQSNSTIYREMYRLFPQILICKGSPKIERDSKGRILFIFTVEKKFFFYALESGNKSSTIPETHIELELEIMKKDLEGRIVSWRWEYHQ